MAIYTNAQETAEFIADRPGASTGPSVVGHRVIQIEQGIEYECEGNSRIITFSNTLLRYGLFDHMELRLGCDGFLYKPEKTSFFQPAFSGLFLGTKINCFEGRRAIPVVAVLAELAIPNTASRPFSADHLAPSLYLLFENPITEWLSIGYNVGSEWNGITPRPTTFAALCLGFNITENLGCFVESYNYLSKSGLTYAVDFGFNHMITRKIQLDMAANIDVQNPAQYWAISFGFTWQINK